MTYNFADFWEAVARHKQDKCALIHDGRQISWRRFEDRAARLAMVMSAAGLGAGSKVGLYLQNSNAYLEATFAAFKQRAVPININYRYQLDELAYLVENADLEGFVFHARYAATVRQLADRFPQLKLFLCVPDDSGEAAAFGEDYEDALDRAAPAPPIARSADDLFMFYTGGTTGMPKGVMYRQGDYARAVMPPVAGRGLAPLASLDDLPRFLDEAEAAGMTPRSLPLCPLMHLTALGLGALISFSLGGSLVTLSGRALDGPRIWSTVVEHDVTSLVIVGDTFARALIEALRDAEARGAPIRPISLKGIISSGAMWSREVKEELLGYLDINLTDGMGSTEGGIGLSVTNRRQVADTASFQLHPGVKVFDDDDREVAPGSGEIGRLAISGVVPIGYYKDPEKSARTFREIDGVRYGLPGDYARIEADGKITLLGRGGSCINTAGEKVFPEEVEEVLKRHPKVRDAAVVGVPDAKFGEAVAAVVAPAEAGAEELIAFARERIAGYKVPRTIRFVDAMMRSPSGKMDYPWAKGVLTE